MYGSAITEHIRAIFLHQKDRVTIAQAAKMLGWSGNQLDIAIRNGDIETTAWRDAAAARAAMGC